MCAQMTGQEPHSSSQSAPYLSHQVRIGMAILRLVGGACAQHARGAQTGFPDPPRSSADAHAPVHGGRMRVSGVRFELS